MRIIIQLPIYGQQMQRTLTVQRLADKTAAASFSGGIGLLVHEGFVINVRGRSQSKLLVPTMTCFVQGDSTERWDIMNWSHA